MSRRRIPAAHRPDGVSAISSGRGTRSAHAPRSGTARGESCRRRRWRWRPAPRWPRRRCEMPSARIRSGSTSMRISSSGAPTTATLATPAICSRRRACTSIAVRPSSRRSLRPVRPSTAIGRSPGSLVSSVGRSCPSGSRARACRAARAPSAPSSACRCPSEARGGHRFAVAAHRAQLHEPRRGRDACSIGSATNRETSSAAAPS
jgi:hypothetical protein